MTNGHIYVYDQLPTGNTNDLCASSRTHLNVMYQGAMPYIKYKRNATRHIIEVKGGDIYFLDFLAKAIGFDYTLTKGHAADYIIGEVLVSLILQF